MPYYERLIRDHFKQIAIWREHGSSCGYAIGHHASGYEGLKMTFVHHNAHNGYQKTNWNMVVYSLINKNSSIEVNLISIISLQSYMCSKHAACFTPPESCLLLPGHPVSY